MKIALYSFTAVLTGFAGFTAAMQTMLDPADTWVPLAVVVGLFVTAILATVKVVRLIDGIRRNQRRIMKHLKLEDDDG